MFASGLLRHVYGQLAKPNRSVQAIRHTPQQLHQLPASLRWNHQQALSDYMTQLEGFGQNGQWVESLQLLEEMSSKGVQVQGPAYTQAIRACAKGNKHDVIVGLFENMVHDDVSPETQVVDHLLEAFEECEEQEKSVQLMQYLKEEGEPIGLQQYTRIIDACNDLRDSESAISFMKYAQQQGMELKDADYASIITICGRSRNLGLITEVLSAMDRANVELGEKTYSAAIRSFVANKAENHALHMLATKDPSIVLDNSIYASIISLCCDAENYWPAVKLYEQLLEQGIILDTYGQAVAVAAYVGARDSDRARTLWDSIDSEVAISKRAFTRISKACKSRGDHSFLLHVVHHMEKFNANMPVHSYAQLIRSYGRQNEMAKAVKVYDEVMENHRIIPPAIFTSAFNACSRNTDASAAFVERVWTDAANARIEMNNSLYSSALNAFGSLGDIDTVNQLLEEDGHSTIAYVGAISGYAKSEKIDEVVKLLGQMKERNVPLSEALIGAATTALIKAERWDDLEGILNDIPASQDHIKNAFEVFGRVIDHLVSVQKWGMVRQWMNVAERMNIIPNIQRYAAVLLHCSSQEDAAAVFNVARQKLGRRSCKPSELHAISAAMQTCVDAGQLGSVAKLWYAQLNTGLSPNLQAHKCAMLSSLRTRRFEAALTIAERLRNTPELEMDVEACGLVMNTLFRSGKYAEVLELWDEIRQADHMDVNEHVVSAAVRAFGRTRQADQIIALRDELIIAGGEIPDNLRDCFLQTLANTRSRKHVVDTWERLPGSDTAAVTAFSKINDYQRVAEILERNLDLPDLDVTAIEATIENLVAQQKFGVAYELIMKALEKNIAGLDRAVRLALPAASRQRSPAAAVRILTFAENQNLDILDATSASSVAALHLRAKNFDQVVKIFRMTAIPFTNKDYNNAIKSCARAQAWPYVIELFKLMRANFLAPSASLTCYALQGCHTENDAVFAREILDDAVRLGSVADIYNILAHSSVEGQEGLMEFMVDNGFPLARDSSAVKASSGVQDKEDASEDDDLLSWTAFTEEEDDDEFAELQRDQRQSETAVESSQTL